MRSKAGLLSVSIALCLTVALGAGCTKTKTDQGADILIEIAELNLEALEDYFDIVEDLFDICNKCVRDTQALFQERQAQMQALADQWMQLRTQMSTKEQMDAIEQARSKVDKIMQKMYALPEGHFETFEEFQSNCSQQTATVYNLMEKYMGLFNKMVGHDFI